MEFLKIFLDNSLSIVKKIKFLLLGLTFLLISDWFTPFPSLIFTHDKYETLQSMQALLKDSTISPLLKKEIKFEMPKIANRKSLSDYLSNFKENIKNTLSIISHAITIKTKYKCINIFFEWLSCIVFLVASGILPITLIGMSFRIDNTIPRKKRHFLFWVGLISIVIIFTVIEVFIFMILGINNHIYLHAFIFFIFILVIPELLIRFVRRYKPNYLKQHPK